ncbi:MAG: transketolase [Deltaproteobacteria bacterium]|nr:MAG: transketolase [Deltaproteobacteria bacterium]
MVERGFNRGRLNDEELKQLQRLATLARGDIIKMTTLAGSGHPGGSMSSVDLFLLIYAKANLRPDDPFSPKRDRIVISHGHTSPGVYAVLGRLGFFDIDAAITTFRQAGSIFEGHVDNRVPGVEWNTGNLGQGLSAGCGMALASRLLRLGYHTFVLMSDGEQTKGQVGEARRFAKKYNLNDLIVLIDYNRLQISGSIDEVMPQDIKAGYRADGWEVIEVDGHDFQEIYQGVREALRKEHAPVAIIAHTVMGKGVSFMENKREFHGRALKPEEYKAAIAELGLEDDLERYQMLRQEGMFMDWRPQRPAPPLNIDVGDPITYEVSQKVGNRKAFGKALIDLAQRNSSRRDGTPIVALNCDLASSVQVEEFGRFFPDRFFEGGIQEHNTATIAGALSKEGVLAFFADFGVFGVDETYNQHRLNDINGTNLKLICTHSGLDVGQDGKTHHCIDYLGVMRNLFGFKVIVPADPNQTDRIIRYIANHWGNFLVAMGREKEPVITKEDGTPFFGDGYWFEYGKGDLIRAGDMGAIITMGGMVHRALKAWEILHERGCYVRVINFSCPLDPDVDILREAARTGLIITYEDHHIDTGLGSKVGNILAEEGWRVRFRKMGVTSYGASGEVGDLFRLQGLDEATLVAVVEEELRKRKNGGL